MNTKRDVDNHLLLVDLVGVDGPAVLELFLRVCNQLFDGVWKNFWVDFKHRLFRICFRVIPLRAIAVLIAEQRVIRPGVVAVTTTQRSLKIE